MRQGSLTRIPATTRSTGRIHWDCAAPKAHSSSLEPVTGRRNPGSPRRENTLQGQKGGGFSITNGLKAVADYGAAIGNVVTSTVTLGHVKISAPYCGFGWASDVGTGFGFVALAALTGGAGGATDVAEGAETVEEAEAGAQAVDDAAPMGGFTESGSTIHDGATATAIGDDPDTLQNLARSNGAAGHDVIVHGQMVDGEGQFIVDGNVTNPQQIADAVLSNPNYAGGPINLVTCYGGCGRHKNYPEFWACR